TTWLHYSTIHVNWQANSSGSEKRSKSNRQAPAVLRLLHLVCRTNPPTSTQRAFFFFSTAQRRIFFFFDKPKKKKMGGWNMAALAKVQD
ncbi:MAG: hypothetical protein IKL23_03970, partial [Oscillospiraceae bacterium]|nr:hypothetical protein [Oscillospiraceae bacterium]